MTTIHDQGRDGQDGVERVRVPLRDIVKDATPQRVALDVTVGRVPPPYSSTQSQSSHAASVSSTNAQLAAVADTMRQWVAVSTPAAPKPTSDDPFRQHGGADALPWVEAGGEANAPALGGKRSLFLGNPITPSRSWGERLSHPEKPLSLATNHAPSKHWMHADPEHLTPASVAALPTPAESSVTLPSHTHPDLPQPTMPDSPDQFPVRPDSAVPSVCHEARHVQEYLSSGSSVFARLTSPRHFTGVQKRRYDGAGHSVVRQELRKKHDKEGKIPPCSGRGTVLETTGRRLEFTSTLRTPPRGDRERKRESGWT